LSYEGKGFSLFQREKRGEPLSFFFIITHLLSSAKSIVFPVTVRTQGEKVLTSVYDSEESVTSEGAYALPVCHLHVFIITTPLTTLHVFHNASCSGSHQRESACFVLLFIT